jgi:hypothetical protein
MRFGGIGCNRHATGVLQNQGIGKQAKFLLPDKAVFIKDGLENEKKFAVFLKML